MKKSLVIVGVLLLLLLAAVLLRSEPPIPEVAMPSFFRILGAATNNSLPYRTFNITNTTGGLMACTPIEMFVETDHGWTTNTLDGMRPKNWVGFDPIIQQAKDYTFDVPVPTGAIRWRLRFAMSVQSPASRNKDRIYNLPQAMGLKRSGRVSLEAHETFTTGGHSTVKSVSAYATCALRLCRDRSIAWRNLLLCAAWRRAVSSVMKPAVYALSSDCSKLCQPTASRWPR